MLLDYLSRFGVALRGIHRKVWYMPLTDYSIHSKRRIFPVLWSNAWKYNIQTKKRLTKVKEKWRTMQFDIFDLSFIFYIPVSQTVSLIKRSGTCYFLHVSNYWWVCWCVHIRPHVSNKTGWHGRVIVHLSLSSLVYDMVKVTMVAFFLLQCFRCK